MRIAQLVAGLAAFVAGEPLPADAADAAQQDGHVVTYSGAEWVLDADGDVLASSTVLVERILSASHGTLVQRTVRESPRPGLLPRESTTSVAIAGTSVTPYALEGLALRDGARVEISERVTRRVLVIRETVRGADGRAEGVHVVDATPLPRDEYDTWMRQLRAP